MHLNGLPEHLTMTTGVTPASTTPSILTSIGSSLQSMLSQAQTYIPQLANTYYAVKTQEAAYKANKEQLKNQAQTTPNAGLDLSQFGLNTGSVGSNMPMILGLAAAGGLAIYLMNKKRR